MKTWLSLGSHRLDLRERGMQFLGMGESGQACPQQVGGAWQVLQLGMDARCPQIIRIGCIGLLELCFGRCCSFAEFV